MRNSDPRNRPSERAPFFEAVSSNAQREAVEEQMRRDGLDPRVDVHGATQAATKSHDA